MLYAFKRSLEVKPKPTTHSLWASAMGDQYIQMHAVYSEGKPFSWRQALTAWDACWGRTCKDHGISPAEGQVLRGRGARYLKDIYDELDDVTVLGHRYPSERQVGNHLITGTISVIRAFEQEDKGKAGRTVQIIFVDDAATHAPSPTEANRRLDYVLAFYGLSLEMRNKYRKLASRVRTMLYLSRLPKLVEYKVDSWGMGHAARWVRDVLRAIEQRILYPRASQRCSYCEYKDLCDVSNTRS
jgi:hypothetical protein